MLWVLVRSTLVISIFCLFYPHKTVLWERGLGLGGYTVLFSGYLSVCPSITLNFYAGGGGGGGGGGGVGGGRVLISSIRYCLFTFLGFGLTSLLTLIFQSYPEGV